MRKLDIGMLSYNNPVKLQSAIESVLAQAVTDFRLVIVDSNSSDQSTIDLIKDFAAKDSRVAPIFSTDNLRYAKGVNELLKACQTEYFVYVENDVQVNTKGFDEIFCAYLDKFHEIGMVLPSGGAYQLDRQNYIEIMWAAGFCWGLNMSVVRDIGMFDPDLGHQEEADYAMRVRMAGYKCAAAREVSCVHHATQTNNPASIDLINKGVVNFVNKWNKYFCGKNYHYHHTNVLRWEDWPPNALYLEEYYKQFIPDLNAAPEERTINGQEYDLIKVPRIKGFYRNRVV